MYGGHIVWYTWCDGIGVDDTQRDENRWDGFADGKDMDVDTRNPKIIYVICVLVTPTRIPEVPEPDTRAIA